jgi:muconolactone delta-isomerase
MAPPTKCGSGEDRFMEFLVEFQLDIPVDVPTSEVEERKSAEAVAADELADHGHLVRLWRTFLNTGPVTILGLYRADSAAELSELLRALPLYQWMHTSVTPLLHHPNDPGGRERSHAYPAVQPESVEG